MLGFPYKRIILKISGESLANKKTNSTIDFDLVSNLARILKKFSDNHVQVGVVIGGGNFWRGRSNSNMNRVKADHIGMLATVMNAVALTDSLEQHGAESVLLTTIAFPQIGELYSPERAVNYLNQNKIVVFGYGTGSAFFSTDTAASLRASETNCEIILKATTIDGVYTNDPKIDPNATKYEKLSFDEMLAKNLKVIDSTAASMCRDNKIPVKIFSMNLLEDIIDNKLDFDFIGTIIVP